MRNYSARWLLQFLLTFLLLAALFRWVDMDTFWAVMHSADVMLCSVAIALFFPGKLLEAYRWYFVLKKLGRLVPFWSVVRHNVLGQFSTFFLPGQVSGDAVRLLAVAHGQPRKGDYVLSVLIDKLALLIAVAGFTLLGLVGSGPVSDLKEIYVAAAVICVSAFLIFVWLCSYRSDYCCAISTEKGAKLRRRWLSQFSAWLSSPQLSLEAAFTVLTLGLLLQLLYTTGSFILARSMHIMINPVEWAAINAIVAFVQLFPITLGGLGVREGVLGAMLSLYAVPLTQSIAFSLISFILVVVLTALCWLVLNIALWTRRFDLAFE